MGSEWKVEKIEDVAEKVAMGPFGSSIKVSTFVSEGIPVISGQHLNKTRLQGNDYNFITLDHAEKLKNSNVYRGDVIFTHAGSIGQVAYIPENSEYERYIISQRQFYMRCDLKRMLPIFVTYYFKSPEGRHKLLANTSSTGVPSISRPVSYLRTIEMPVPPLPEQRAIAHILGSLDDKIELNRKMNETLEAMARAIFKSWFIDFDPVRAKAEGRDPGLPKEIADLFPNSFEDSDLGQIPKGWKILPISSLLHINPRLKLSKGDVAKYVDMKALPTSGYSVSAVIEKFYKGGSKFQQYDVLLARITPCLENGKTALVDFLYGEEVAFGSTEFIVLRGKDGVTSQYVYCLARNIAFREHCISSMVGSSGRQRVQNACFDHFEQPVPHERILQAFAWQTEPLFNNITANSQQIQTLSNLRDTLLPKLISGELHVSDAEKFIEETLR